MFVLIIFVKHNFSLGYNHNLAYIGFNIIFLEIYFLEF